MKRMTITDSAKAYIEQLIKLSDVKGIRLYMAGYSWGGPQIKLALEGPSKHDELVTINGVQVAIEKEIVHDCQVITLDYQEAVSGASLVLLGVNHC